MFLSEDTPYTKEMLSIIFNRPVDLIDYSLKVLVDLKMIEIYKNGVINIINWNKYQNIEGMERVREQTRKRVIKYRSKNKENKIKVSEEKLKNTTHENQAVKKPCEENVNKICNVTVTKQNKSENKNKSKMEKKINIDTGLETEGVGETEIIEYIEGFNIKIRGGNLNAIKAAVSIHGGENVKLAIDKALEVDRPRMNYINGILNNWRMEGYPKNCIDLSSNSEVNKQYSNHKALKFNNFEPRKYDYEKLEKELLGWEKD